MLSHSRARQVGGGEEASPSCPAASEIGHTLVGTGVGVGSWHTCRERYIWLVACSTERRSRSWRSPRRSSGLFDLGTYVAGSRFGLNIDPYTAQVSVSPNSSEPIPTILDGIVTTRPRHLGLHRTPGWRSVYAEPDQLQPDDDREHPHEQPGRECDRDEPVPIGELREPGNSHRSSRSPPRPRRVRRTVRACTSRSPTRARHWAPTPISPKSKWNCQSSCRRG